MVKAYSDPGADKLYLDDMRFEPFWAALEELGVPLNLHSRLPARAVQEAMYRGHPELVGAAWGFAPETATHVLRLVYGGVLDRHPGAKRDGPISENDRRKICYDNAAALFALRP